MKKQTLSFLSMLLIIALVCSGCSSKKSNNKIASETAIAISFLDDDGNEIQLEKPCSRIISLYSAHTENLYSLGADSSIIGTHKTAIYPPDAAFLPRYDYQADPETIIAAEPDLVLIRPFISRKSPEFVESLKTAGIPVVSLYPDTFEEFDDYIQKLALLTGTEENATELLKNFHKGIENITTITNEVPEKQSIFFESTEVDLRTVTPDSMAGKAIQFAGGKNIAEDAKPVKKGSSIASFGEEKVLAKANEIDVYVSQRGAMNAGGNKHSISIRPGFDTIKAIQEDRVFVINEKLISSPTFRYLKGVQELARFLYPEQLDSLEDYENDSPTTKRDFANILVKYHHMPIFVPSSSKYYTQNHTGHIYGMFDDVMWTDKDFDAIETAVMSGAIPWEEKGDKQFFYGDNIITKETLAKSIFILYDLKNQDTSTSIQDISDCENANIVQCIVDNEILPLENGKFNPKQELTNQEVLTALQKASKK